MKRSTRMMLMNTGNRSHENERGRDRNYDRPRENYDDGMYDKFRDDRGREHYDNGRFAPRDEHEGNYGARMHYSIPMTPYVPPVYQYYDERNKNRNYERRDFVRRDSVPLNKIGFALSGEMDKLPPMEIRNDYSGDEMAYRKGERMSGYSTGEEYIPFTRETAEKWISNMENEDGTKGPHWTLDQTKQVMAQRGIECDPLEFWVAMNMIYSDYEKAAKRNNANTVDFYADMAKSFLDDKDAPKDKLARYYYYIADIKE